MPRTSADIALSDADREFIDHGRVTAYSGPRPRARVGCVCPPGGIDLDCPVHGEAARAMLRERFGEARR
jgi:hypothetical protein